MVQFSVKDLLLLSVYIIGGMMAYSLLVLVLRSSIDVEQLGREQFLFATVSIRLAGACIGAMLWVVVHLMARMR
ncbi:hypothetical protein NG895_28155 [Aeoliella sp. ICT_H6.2]|uniref:Uncharacterized protein n=1 Tax=Aeoliella straminimaris TaxID=2954799 RepID=A0A9X2FJ36_9BACT|nr:hypothetical protein [Aeoliella straminimaris]MCO6047796.1 hypothetical protein [Aeoliella straminimaris]